MWVRLGVLVLGVCLVACGGGDESAALIDAGAPSAGGIAKRLAGEVRPVEGLKEGRGQLLLDLIHTDRSVNNKVKITLHPADDPETVAARGEGNHEFDLAVGVYNAEIAYTESELVSGLMGQLSGLKVNPGHQTRYQVDLIAPIGILKMRFSKVRKREEPLDFSANVELSVYPADQHAGLVEPLWKGPASDTVVLPSGTYQARAVYELHAGFPTREWYRDLVVAEGMARTEREVLLQADDSGVRIDAFNYSRDVSERTMVYLFFPGANVEIAVARFSSPAGQVMEAAPGEYDLWMIYHPSDANPTLKGTKKIEGLVVPEVGGVRRRVDLETPLGMLRIAVVSGEEDWSDRVEIRVMRSGADPAAASPVLDEIGLGEHHMPVGTYDVYLNFEMTEGVNRSEVFKNVGLGNAYVWDQRFDATETEWVAQKVKVPAEPAVPIQAIAEPAGDDDSAGDDDDSAGDDESASGTESGASEGGDAAGAEAAEAAGAAEAAAPDAAPVVPAQPAEGRAELR